MSCENACKILPAAKQWKWPAQTKFKEKKTKQNQAEAGRKKS